MQFCTRWKQYFTLVLLLILSLQVSATEPTTTSSNLVFSNVDGSQFTLSFKAGNGSGRIVVVKAGSEITGKPTDGVNYTGNQSFGSAGTEFTASGEYVVSKTTGLQPSLTITNLQPGTVYYVAIFEYNTGGSPDPDYSAITPTAQTVRTVSAPTVQSNLTGITAVTGKSVKVNWTNGNGTGRIIVGRKGTSLTAAPADLKTYGSSTVFGANTGSNFTLDAETFVLFKTSSTGQGQAGTADITNLEPNTSYTFAIFEYNGYNSPVYLMPAAIKTVITSAGPAVPPGSITFNAIDGTSLSAYWTMGDASRSLVVVKKGSPVTFRPQNGQAYSANAVFGNQASETAPGSGEYIVGNLTSGSISVSGLEKSSTYYFAIFGFDADVNGNTYYLTSSFSEKSQSTAMAPTKNKVLSIASVTGSTAQLAWTPGNGTYHLVAIREGAPVEFVPQDLVKYNSSTSVFGAGTQVLPGNFLLYSQTNGGAPNITGLQPGRTYHVSVFEMNGSTNPVYLVPGASVVVTIPNEPTTAPSSPSFLFVEGNSIRFDWTSGNGSRRIVVAKKNSAVTQRPQDGITYTANAEFGAGSTIGTATDEFVVYEGSGNSMSLTGLEKGTTYHFAVFEYNTGAGGPDYLSSAGKWLATSKATLTAPTVQVSALSASNIQANQATLNFTKGNGASRIFIMKENAPVDAEPQDYISYKVSSGIFNLSQSEIGTGNCVVGAGFQLPFIVAGLKPATTYHVAVFEFNGSTGPVYLKPAHSYSFTTTGSQSVPPPTVPASNAVFENVDGNKLTLNWTSGNGVERLVIGRKSTAVQHVPSDGASYTANAAFGSGADLGAEQFVVYKGLSNKVTITNLAPETVYHFAVYEYNGTGINPVFLPTPLLASHATATTPVSGAVNPVVTTTTGSVNLSWTNGSGANRLIVAKESGPVNGIPANLSYYSPNAIFKSGSQIAQGEYAVYAGAGNSVQVTGLTAGKTYHFSIFEYNGFDAPMYNTSMIATATASFAALPVTWLQVAAVATQQGVVINWATAQEINTSYFEVERSNDGISFYAIGTVKAAGNSEFRRNYSFTDKTNAEGKLYYRIRQIDIDHKFTNSKIIQLTIDLQSSIFILQNPVTDLLKLRLTGNTQPVTIQIFDLAGNVMYKGVAHSSVFDVPVTYLRAGIYHVSVKLKNGKVHVLRFVKR